MDRKPLTPTQRRILMALREHGTAAFFGGTRSFYVKTLEEGGVVINAYCTPEWFLAGRGLIVRVPRNLPGEWYKLSEAGEARAATLKTEPPRRERRTIR